MRDWNFLMGLDRDLPLLTAGECSAHSNADRHGASVSYPLAARHEARHADC